ncbi:sulfatase-like hydrolase/transferase [Alkalilimnicola sp. S0819]|uniref:sulfatase-like hydrolase/transferase n=1 Tax=Alkalilimnicola sp. S0819 TaxID=2613922 RepID=UPI001262771D|nr:sulfatase-like hydrolase/transferase [Alkalilimnicola sp. S0819]KAB7619523.1 sulfatase-like hydrolase/transferase [Alkalilimnicola sp. S0819]MPQ17672.1 sulfatase-like hydrolase/transferase [Alkalilimnicola sp. S0819]
MSKIRNFLFIMADQLRADYLSCYGHKVLHTPHIDGLAARGVRFTRAYVQSGVCGPSRMSYYTGRYPSSHGATWNFIPMPVDEMGLGDYLEAEGRSLHLVGKTHVEPDREGMERLGLDPASDAAALLREGGFRVIARHEGDLPSGKEDYKAYLERQGYEGEDPWLEYANSGRDARGRAASGWLMRNAHLPAAVDEQHSETAYATDEALKFITEQGDQPWALHLSYIKPHWPYIVPAPYHDMYREADTGEILPAQTRDEHPVLKAYRKHDEALSFSRPEVVRHVRPTYMGLIKQIDDHLGRLFTLLEESGRMEDTLIVFCADHGDFLGDRGFGEKELFFEEVQRVPFIVYDPSEQADATRGTTSRRLVEAVDVVPTALEALGVEIPRHRVEGRSLLPLTRKQPVKDWRRFAISELDYTARRARKVLRRSLDDNCRGWMVRSDRWKFVYWDGYRAQLFDMKNDPKELHDLGADPAHAEVREEHQQMLLRWMLSRKSRVAATYKRLDFMTDNLPPGIHIGQW